MAQNEAEESVWKIRLWLRIEDYFATRFEQLTVLNTGWTRLFAGAAAETAIDMRGEGAGSIFESSLGHRAHEIQPPARPIILVAGDDVRRARLETQTAMDAGE